ncbi:DUF294 nucleotidyltransferase-like domain-containing protein [Croceiramulus getboli]|nr:DUF294 nucleotidyltransferase-like domain-containing protein [Flavobacteriaceae bacterium YJPT1-3]
MGNSIAERIYDFIKKYPPFHFLSKPVLLDICEQVEVAYFEKNEVIFEKNEDYHKLFYVVHEGAVRLVNDLQPDSQMVDICDEGDIFGLRPLITKENYQLYAVANEETIVYGIPIEHFLPIALSNNQVSNFLIASFASNVPNPSALQESGKLFTPYSVERSSSLIDHQKAQYSKKPIVCGPKTEIQVAARLMRKKKVGALVVVKEGKPVGILTNRDLRNTVATGDHGITEPVKAIMSSPVRCFKKDLSAAQAQLIMLKNNINHLCFTEDGTPDTKLVGILTQHDLKVSLANNPVVLLKAIKRAPKASRLREIRQQTTQLLRNYLEQNLPLSHIAKIVTEINEAIVIRSIELALAKMVTPPPCKFAWLAIGSQGRGEQLLLTDQDNALVFEDVSQEKANFTQDYFVKLASRVNKIMHKVGYAYCAAEMMASNPKWCLPLSQWKKQFHDWITIPTPENILYSSIFFDYAYIYGETTLVTKLSDSILNSLKGDSRFFSVLAKDALKNPPPLGFFRQFLVEYDGKHKDIFDIKSRAMLPLIDAARILVLATSQRNVNNTASRFEHLATIEPQNRELYENCAYAFKALLKFRTRQGLKNGDTGKLIKLESLTKAERLKLKRCFKPLKDIQEVLKVRFQL